MTALDKFTSLKFKNRAGFIYDNDRVSWVQYEDTEDKNEDYSEEDQEDENYTESEIY